MARSSVAIIGSGISGLSAAWLLATSHDVVLFEQDDRAGGHSNTVDVQTPEGVCAIDTGFIVYNTACYPNLIALFEHLGVATAPSNMSFSVSLRNGAYEYSGTGAHGLFGQPSNIFDAGHWRMCRDIPRFFREAEALHAAAVDEQLGLGAWLDRGGYSREFIDHHILPMAAAIWSAPVSETLAYPAAAFARFFANHGLLQVRNRPKWRTVQGGSREYVRRLTSVLGGRVRLGDGVASVNRRGHAGVEIATVSGKRAVFDQVVLATQADQALALLADADDMERTLLSPFRYAENEAFLHSDAHQMPRRRRLWSSWNFVAGTTNETAECPATTSPVVSYWMNRLQPLATKTDYFVTLNPQRPIEPTRVAAQFSYRHPVFDTAALSAQRHLWQLQGRRRTWFCGSYFGSGFHEDALQAGLAVAEELGGVRRPWTVANESSRIPLPRTWADAQREAAQ